MVFINWFSNVVYKHLKKKRNPTKDNNAMYPHIDANEQSSVMRMKERPLSEHI